MLNEAGGGDIMHGPHKLLKPATVEGLNAKTGTRTVPR